VSFLNGILILGAFAAVVPLAIHLFNRSRFKIVKWGATHLLESVLRKNRKQIQLEQWIILLIRCAIPVILALTLARMVVMNWNSFLFFLLLPLAALLFLILIAFSRTTGWLWGFLSLACLLATLLGAFGFVPEWDLEKKLSAPSGEVPASTVILLDDSLSMNTANGFSKAQSFISGFLQNMNPQSETAVIQLGGEPALVFDKPTSDPGALGLRVDGLFAQGDQISLLSGLDQALSVVSNGKNLKREIILLSDFRTPDWEEWKNATGDAFRERLNSTPNPPNLTWVDFGNSASKNLSVEKIVLSAQTVGIGHPLRVRATLRNFSDESFEGNLLVRLLGDQNESALDEAMVSVGPKASTQVSFTHRFKEAGPKVLHIELSEPDDLPQDNRRSVAVGVIEQIGVLLVDGDPSKEWLRGETDFIKLALTPFQENTTAKNRKSGAGLEMKDLIKASTIPADQFRNMDPTAGVSLIVLANLESLEGTMIEELPLFVENGGGVLICGGNRMNLSWYNQHWGLEGSNFLPLPMTGSKGNLQNEFEFSKIANTYFEHPALSLFNDPRNGSLSEARIKKWIELDESQARNDPGVTVVARLENGDPLLVEKKWGKGVVMFLTTSIDTDWNNLPARPSYLPFVQQISTYLSEKVLPPKTVSAGFPLTHYLSEGKAEVKYHLMIPNGSKRKLIPRKRKDRYVLEFTDTRLPGTYYLSEESQVISKFVVLASRAESNLNKVEKEQIMEASAGISEKLTLIDGRDGKAWNTYQSIDQLRKFGRETWKILLAVVLGLIVMEMVLLRRFGRMVR
jgi:hypothetical protein